MAAERVILTWNLTNWITVVIMAAVGFGVLAVITNAWAKRKVAVTQ